MQEYIRGPGLYIRRDELHPHNHAKKVDKLLGFRIPRIEEKLLQKYRAYDKPNDDSSKKRHFEGTQTWIGLHPQALQTPYNDIYEAFLALKDFDIKRVVDIGAGYGRVGIVMNVLFPNAEFIGYEILKVRGAEGNRIFKHYDLKNCTIYQKNVLKEDFDLPEAQVYFIYDFSEIEDIEKILDQLLMRKQKQAFFLIAKGDRIDFLLNGKYKGYLNTNEVLSSGELKVYNFIGF